MKSIALVNYPYQHSSSGEVFPMVPIRLFFRDRTFYTPALVDSGASISVFHINVAETLGIKVESGKEIYMGGVGGRIKGYINEVGIEVGGRRFVCPIVFSHEYLVSFNLLGRKGVFDQFTIVFEEKLKRLRFD